ncbi:regulatory protein GemA [Cedecea neteri]|uniref:gp16 family protein n=1 Tax=Cedecea neteri TaxID=158822 RepID=UPI002AA843CC|nr:regulatory protein GemA [Cedecea neteri]WPU22587.1 regulatory protein GemA [Cedecea neteri]
MLNNKKALIGAIKAGQNWLQWDDSTYRGVMFRITGKVSSTKCSMEELQNLREYMHEQGFPRKTARKHGRRPNVATGRKATLGKIEALLADAGRPWQYAESVSQRMFEQKVIEWLDDEQLTKLLQALIIDARRRQKNEI